MLIGTAKVCRLVYNISHKNKSSDKSLIGLEATVSGSHRG